VARKLVFTTPFYSACKGPSLWLLGCYTAGLYSWWSPMRTTYVLSHDLPSSPRLLPYAAEKKERYGSSVVCCWREPSYPEF
jgi:hypothetical protein